MRQPIPLRLDYDAAGLRRIARESEDADQVRRLLALAVIYEGGSRTEAAGVGGAARQRRRPSTEEPHGMAVQDVGTTVPAACVENPSRGALLVSLPWWVAAASRLSVGVSCE